MKILLYVNKDKDADGEWLKKTADFLKKENLDFSVLTDDELDGKTISDAIIVLGGDGTILFVNEFANKNGIPVIGINAGKLGFLTEFEKFETESAIKFLIKNKLVKDERTTIEIGVCGKTYNALNEVVIQRVFDNTRGSVISVSVKIDGNEIETVTGDGVIICTPTGSTAYSLSAGGAILAPGTNAFSLTPIAAHSLSHRPVIFSADNDTEASLTRGGKAGVFVDGKLVAYITDGETVSVRKAKRKTVFLRKVGSDFFKILTEKMKSQKRV